MNIIRAKEVRLAIIAFAALVLVAALVNVPLAVSLIEPPRKPLPNSIINVQKPEAVARGWPVRTPHDQPWPEPSQWQADSAWFGHHRITVWARPDAITETTHQMQFDEYGWPVPSLRRLSLWWPGNDPAWATTAPRDSGLRLAWAGVILNPLVIGGASWTALVALPWAVVILRRVIRRRRGLCIRCGYDLTGLDDGAVCPECGESP